MGVLGLGLTMVNWYFDFSLQGRRFRVVYRGAPGLDGVDNGVFSSRAPIHPLIFSDPGRHHICF
jgi:hypothetical protein